MKKLIFIIGAIMAIQCEKTPEPEPEPPKPEPKIETGMVYVSGGSIVNLFSTATVVGIILTKDYMFTGLWQNSIRYGSKVAISGVPASATADAAKAEKTPGYKMTEDIMAFENTGNHRFPAARLAVTYHPDGIDFKESSLPTVYEIETLIIPNLAAINETRVKMGEEPISGRIWAANPAANDKAWAVDLDTKEVIALDRDNKEQVLLIASVPNPIQPFGPNSNKVPNPDPVIQPDLFPELGMYVYSQNEVVSLTWQLLDDSDSILQGIALGGKFTGWMIHTVENFLDYGRGATYLDEKHADILPTYYRTPWELQAAVYAHVRNSPAINYARRFGTAGRRGDWAICTAEVYKHIKDTHMEFLRLPIARAGLPPIRMGPFEFGGFWTNHHANSSHTWFWDSYREFCANDMGANTWPRQIILVAKIVE
ncbi:MAG: hypothetical protein FWD56_06270 [Bacteroidales bacterium]|nr:hypothetical protein [Bacteroidales bacterium]